MKALYRQLIIVSFFVAFATTAFPIFIPAYLDELGLSNVEIGVSLAVLYMTSALLSLFVGYVEEKIDKIKILVSSYFGYVLLPLFYLNITGLASIFLVRIYDGVISSLRYVSRYSILESKKAYETGINVSLNEALSNIGCLLGPLAAGAVAAYYGINMIFIIASIILFFIALYSLKMLKFSKHKFNHNIHFSLVFRELFHNKSLIILSSVFLLFAIVNSSKFMVVTLYLKSIHFNNLLIGLVGSSFFFFMFLFELFSGYLEKESRRNIFLTVGLILCAGSYFLFSSLTLNLYTILFFSLLFSLGTAFVRPAIFANLVSIEKDNSNIGTGILFFFSNIGSAIGLVISGILIQISFKLFFISGAGLLLFSSFIVLIFYKSLQQSD